MVPRPSRRSWLLIASLALFGILGFLVASTTGAQTPGETPEGTPAATQEDSTPSTEVPASEEPTPGPDVLTTVRLSVDPAIQPIPEGEEFEVQVLVEQVEHLAGFQFAIGFDPELIEPVFGSASETPSDATVPEGTPVEGSNTIKTANLGEFLRSSGREEILCSPAVAEEGRALVTCSLLGPPVCAGGEPGVSGDGLLGSLYFESKGGGTTELTVADSDLVLDDIAPPCEIAEESDIVVIPIQHQREGVTIELEASDSNSGVILGIIVGVIVALVVVGGGTAYLFYRRRQASAAT